MDICRYRPSGVSPLNCGPRTRRARTHTHTHTVTVTHLKPVLGSIAEDKFYCKTLAHIIDCDDACSTAAHLKLFCKVHHYFELQDLVLETEIYSHLNVRHAIEGPQVRIVPALAHIIDCETTAGSEMFILCMHYLPTGPMLDFLSYMILEFLWLFLCHIYGIHWYIQDGVPIYISYRRQIC